MEISNSERKAAACQRIDFSPNKSLSAPAKANFDFTSNFRPNLQTHLTQLNKTLHKSLVFWLYSSTYPYTEFWLKIHKSVQKSNVLNSRFLARVSWPNLTLRVSYPLGKLSSTSSGRSSAGNSSSDLPKLTPETYEKVIRRFPLNFRHHIISSQCF